MALNKHRTPIFNHWHFMLNQEEPEEALFSHFEIEELKFRSFLTEPTVETGVRENAGEAQRSWLDERHTGHKWSAQSWEAGTAGGGLPTWSSVEVRLQEAPSRERPRTSPDKPRELTPRLDNQRKRRPTGKENTGPEAATAQNGDRTPIPFKGSTDPYRGKNEAKHHQYLSQVPTNHLNPKWLTSHLDKFQPKSSIPNLSIPQEFVYTTTDWASVKYTLTWKGAQLIQSKWPFTQIELSEQVLFSTQRPFRSKARTGIKGSLKPLGDNFSPSS